MTKNMGVSDRIIRLIIGVAIFVAPLLNIWGLGSSSTIAYILMAIGAIFVLTSVISFCPVYAMLNVSTDKS